MILPVNMPPVLPVMRKMRAIKAATATTTRTPTFSCDHWISCWLGTYPLGLKRAQRVSRCDSAYQMAIASPEKCGASPFRPANAPGRAPSVVGQCL